MLAPALLLAVLPLANLPDDAPVHLGISLKIADQPGLSRLLAAQQDPRSPSYHSWLDPAAFADRFGVSESDYAALVDWLTGRGFAVTRYPNRMFLEAVGHVGAVRGALGVQPRRAEPRGRAYRTFDGEIQVPARFRDAILHISGLDTRIRIRHRLTVPFDGMPTQVLGPADLRLQYDVQPLLAGGGAAAGLTTAVLGAQEGTSIGDAESCGDSSPTTPFIAPSADAIQAYLSLASSSASYKLTQLPNTNQDFDTCGSNEEAQLDVEMQSVGAANATTINLVLAPASEIFTTGAQYIVNSLPKSVAVSMSIGLCESEEAQYGGGGPTQTGSEMQAFEQTVMQGLAEGQTWFAAAGDTGADDCNDNTSGTHNGFNSGNATIDFPGCLPEMVDVGGTQFSSESWNGAGALTAIAPEVAWNEQEIPALAPLGPGAGGGGQSRYFTKPSYQQGVGPTSSDGARDVPDFALAAASNTPGVAVYDCGSGQDQTCAGATSGAGPIDIYGGTSVASPLAAGFFAALAGKVGCRLGDIHPAIYTLGSAQAGGGTHVFNDVTKGNNSFTGPSGSPIVGFTAGPGYDLVTGWGSLDVAALAANWPICETKTSTTLGGCSSAAGAGAGDALWLWLPLVFVGLGRLRRRPINKAKNSPV